MSQSEFKELKVLDGGFGVQAIERSTLKIEGHKLWSCRLLLDDPELVVAIHRDFVSAGAQVIETNTYQANVDSFLAALPDSMTPSLAAEALASGVSLARRAVDAVGVPGPGRILVAASCGPYGAAQCDLSEFTGSYCDFMSEEDLIDWHRPRLAALASAGPDLIAFDTVPALIEARALARLMREFPGLPAWISFASRDGRRTCRGESLTACAEDPLLADPASGVFALGVNCIVAPRNVASAALALRASRAFVAAGKSIVAYPNLGDCGERAEPLTDELVTEWLRLGVDWIGGCCRVGPAEIAGVAAAVGAYRSRASSQSSNMHSNGGGGNGVIG